MPVGMLQLQQHGIFGESWRSKATCLMHFNVFSFCQHAKLNSTKYNTRKIFNTKNIPIYGIVL